MTLPAWVAVLVAVALAAALAAWLRAHREARRLQHRLGEAALALERLQSSFARFAPEAVVERIIAGGLPTAGERKEVTALFADLVGYTPLAERRDPSELVELLNGYFERMSRAISEHRGHISTFVGDGLLALFGAFEPNPWQANDAAHAALAMRRELAEYNRELDARGLPALAIGIGIHQGVGVAGLVGSRDRKEFAVVGRTVNVAARVQDLTRQHGVDVLLTKDTRKKLDPRFRLRELPAARLKGIDHPLVVHAVEGFDGPA